ncbi:MAG: 5-nucleotidase protein [Frankiales bacterium]|nr:5-nucleotidase protein [Frankiales bacterium]
MPHLPARTAARTLALSTAAATALAAGVLATPAHAQAAPTVELQVLGINDFHGHLDPAPGSAPSVAGVLGGAVKALRAENPDTAFAAAGDLLGASPFISSSQKDEPTIDALNAMGLDAASAVGNHEFDRGYADLAQRVVPRARWPYLGANVVGESPDLPSTNVVTTPSGVRIGFVGVVTGDTASLVSPAGIPGISFTDPAGAVDREATRLSDRDESNGEADVVVVLAHEGPSTSGTTAAACAEIAARDDAFGRILRGAGPDVDAIFAGHTHLTVDCEFPKAGGGVLPVLEASEYGKALGQLKLTYDTVTRSVTRVDGRVLPLTPTSYPADPAVEAVVDAAEARSAELGREVIGSITEDIPRAKTSSGAEDRGTESLLGNFVADVQLGATSGASQPGGPAQIALMNPGGLRADLLYGNQNAGEAPGQITYAEAAVVQPFANTLFTLTLTGAQLEQVLEEQYQPAGSSRPFLALGVSRGFRYELEGTAPAGSRISNLTLDGAAVSPTGTYRIVTNSFLAAGGDNFRTLAAGTDRRDTGQDDLAVLVAHFRASSPVTPDKTDRSVVRSLLPAPSPSATPTVTTSPSATPTPTVSATPSATPTPVRDGTCVFGQGGYRLDRSEITPGQSVQLQVTDPRGDVPVRVYAYTRPSAEYRLVRESSTETAFTLRPPGNTRLYVTGTNCDEGTRVITVRNGVSINARRDAPRVYTFSGTVLPRQAGTPVSLYRVADGRSVLTAQARTGADGVWRVTRRFTGSGEFGFVARTANSLQNAAGASRVRPTVVH